MSTCRAIAGSARVQNAPIVCAVVKVNSPVIDVPFLDSGGVDGQDPCAPSRKPVRDFLGLCADLP